MQAWKSCMQAKRDTHRIAHADMASADSSCSTVTTAAGGGALGVDGRESRAAEVPTLAGAPSDTGVRPLLRLPNA